MAFPSSLFGRLLTPALAATLLLRASTAAAAYDCTSANPADWPPPAKPYFMIAFDTSGSMNDTVTPNPSCAGYSATKIGHARCALSNMIKAYAGEVDLGLMTFPRVISKSGGANGPNTCPGNPANANNCQISNLYAGGDQCGTFGTGANAAGGNILVPLEQDDYFDTPPTATSNSAALLNWVDNSCTNCQELYAAGNTPLDGLLRDAYRYLSSSWTPPGGTAINTPLTATERPCRSVNVLLMTDGQENCNPDRVTATYNATNAAAALLAGWDITSGPNTIHWSANTYVIAIGADAATTTDTNAIAAAGGTTAAHLATNETQLSQALSAIIAGAIKPEVCDNTDNNCNGCVDEGSKKFCNRNRTGRTVAYLSNAANNPGAGDCCSDVRATCLADFAASITGTKPQGDAFWLPCWDPQAAFPPGKAASDLWLCSDPGEVCDDKDNNCDTEIDPTKAAYASNVVDENQLKCTDPGAAQPHCPQPETCDTKDNDCDQIIDNKAGSSTPGSVCPFACVPQQETCNGCDDDCDGIADNGVADQACGFSPPASCAGTETCGAPQAVPKGGCIGSLTQPGTPQWGACSAKGTNNRIEICDGVDNDCDGVVDDNPVDSGGACTPNPGDPTVGPCQAGILLCVNAKKVCDGYVGPTPEICDGIDNDCNGKIDDNPVGVGQPCGSTVGACKKTGTTSCVGGLIVCTGPNTPQPEVCDGIDNDCNGVTDDNLTDKPANTACWAIPYTSACTHKCSLANAQDWCAPDGATCNGLGTLTGACATGLLTCDGPNHYVCHGGQGPAAEDCNGVDDNCNGQTDENLGAPFGAACGKTVAGTPCLAGTLICDNGTRKCNGEVPPQPEICNGVDDDCDGTIDNGVAAGTTCAAAYDTSLYPGTRQGGACVPGAKQCTATGGSTCVGGTGPSPEVCDGKDNDCDGVIDEAGTAPDGLNGTADPLDKTHVIGQPCSTSAKQCNAGKWACTNGRVACEGSKGAQPEVCDCIDNDCDGQIDEDPGPNENPLCPGGTTCVKNGSICQCAAPCGSSEFPCPVGQTCDPSAIRSGSTNPAPTPVCLVNDPCVNCPGQTVTGSDGNVECEPAGTPNSGSRPIPACECKGASGCHAPCVGVQCTTAGQACAPATGTCQSSSNCFYFGCPDGQLCTGNKNCIANPCLPNPCPPSGASNKDLTVCRPTANFASYNCVGSCAGKTCPAGQTCSDGTCEATGCSGDCPTGQYCFAAKADGGTGVCGPSRCTGDDPCQGEYCDPVTAGCGPDPCDGVECPTGQACASGQCVIPTQTQPTSDGGTTKNDGGNATGPGSHGGPGGNGNPKAAFGLATGGGGCSCSLPTKDESPTRSGVLIGFAAALAFATRRKTRRDGKGGVR